MAVTGIAGFQDFCKYWAKENFTFWYEQVMESGLKHMIKVANTLKDHPYGLLAWFDTRVTNALTEGFNTTIQALKARLSPGHPAALSSRANQSPFLANGTGEATHVLRSGGESHTDRSSSSRKGRVLHSDEPSF